MCLYLGTLGRCCVWRCFLRILVWIVAGESTSTFALAVVEGANVAVMRLVDFQEPLVIVPEGEHVFAVGTFVVILDDERVREFAVYLECAVDWLFGCVGEGRVITAHHGDCELEFVKWVDVFKVLVRSLFVLVGLELGDVDCALAGHVAGCVLAAGGVDNVLGPSPMWMALMAVSALLFTA